MIGIDTGLGAAAAVVVKKCQNDNSWDPVNVVEMSCCHMSSAYVDHLDMLNKFCFHVYAHKSLFMIVCHAVMLSYVKCLCSSLGYAEQLLFSCLCSEVTVYDCLS